MSVREKVEEQLRNFHWNTYAARMNMGISQVKLAQLSGVSHVSVSRIESTSDEDCNLFTALCVANALGTDLNTLFNERVELGLIKPHMGRPTNRERRKK